MRSDNDDLLTTGQAAELLGTTVQHVVNLCARGELPYTLTGTHRRIRRSDAEALRDRAAANRGGPMTRDQTRSLWLHRAAVAHVAKDPEQSLSLAKATILRRLDRQPHGGKWLRQWLSVIERGPEVVMRTMTSTDPFARELRQNSPFLNLLTDDERMEVLEAFRKAGTRAPART